MKKKIAIFNIFSISLLLVFIVFYVGRILYYKYDSKNITYSKILSERIIQEDNDFKLIGQLKKKNNTYYFVSKSKNNYVNYKGLIWRIIKISDDGTITIILQDSVNNMTYHNTLKWLNYYEVNNTGIFEKFLYNINIYNEDNNYLSKKEYLNCSNTNTITLLSEEDYNIVGSNNSYISNNIDFWISSNKYIDIDGSIKLSESNEEYHNIRPVITLNNNTEISSGDGSIDNPYFIKREHANTLKDIDTGSIIKYNNELWKVIEINEDNIKILKEECLKDDNKECIEMIFQEYTNTIDIDNTESLLYYLNNIYYDSLPLKDYLTYGTLHIGKYMNNDYTSIYSDTITVNVGLPSLADIYSLQIDNTFLITSNSYNNLNIYISKNNKIYETLVNEKAYVRPILYLKKNISVTGLGTLDSPYELGEIINEE